MPLGDGPFDETVFFSQVKDVIFIDPGRRDQQRCFIDLGRARAVLNKLHQPVLIDDLARRGRDVFADLKGFIIGHARHEFFALAAREIGQQRPRAADQVFAPGVDGFPEHGGIGQGKIGR